MKARLAWRALTALGIGLTAAMAFVPGVRAQAYPAKAIRIVVPFPAGGTSDILSRAVGQKLAEAWKQPVIVDNRPGAGAHHGAQQRVH